MLARHACISSGIRKKAVLHVGATSCGKNNETIHSFREKYSDFLVFWALFFQKHGKISLPTALQHLCVVEKLREVFPWTQIGLGDLNVNSCFGARS